MDINPATVDTSILILVWIAYFVIHSLLASLRVKHFIASTWPAIMPGYRLFFNCVAIVLLAVPLWLTAHGHAVPLWQWRGPWQWLSGLLSVAALAGFAFSLRYYDGQEFIGLRQLRKHITSVEDQEHFQLSPLHQYVRHPWYFLALVLIWTRDMDSLWLISASMMSLYFILGSRLEESKLIQYYGDVYRQYMRKVPGIFPLPWRHLTKAQAEELIRRTHER